MAAAQGSPSHAFSQRPAFPPPKVLTMSKNTHKHPRKHTLSNAPGLLAKLESELAQGYVEVGIDGISFMQLVYIYLAGARELRDRTAQHISRWFRLHPAH